MEFFRVINVMTTVTIFARFRRQTEKANMTTYKNF